jgi:hypothetical protein
MNMRFSLSKVALSRVSYRPDAVEDRGWEHPPAINPMQFPHMAEARHARNA